MKLNFPGPPKFDDPYKERAYLKGRLAAAFRIFGKFGFDEGVAGHITLRVGALDLSRGFIPTNGLFLTLRRILLTPPLSGSIRLVWRSA